MFEDIVNFLVQIVGDWGINLVVGVSHAIDSFTYGAFFEAGKGSYDTFNSFADSSVVRGKGDNKFYGLGIALQNDFTDGYYIDASLRAGKSKMDYKSNDFGGLAKFKMNRNYMGTHLGFGKVTQIGENQELDVYLKGLYSRLDKKDVSIRGDKMSFDALNSFRTKLGARYLYELNDTAQIYSGVAYEREFAGSAKIQPRT